MKRFLLCAMLLMGLATLLSAQSDLNYEGFYAANEDIDPDWNRAVREDVIPAYLLTYDANHDRYIIEETRIYINIVRTETNRLYLSKYKTSLRGDWIYIDGATMYADKNTHRVCEVYINGRLYFLDLHYNIYADAFQMY